MPLIAFLLAAYSAAPETPAVEAPPVAVAPRLIERPRWLRRPSGEDIARTYPRRAASRRLGSRVVMECRVTAKGKMTDCRVLSESPPGLGFGEAALKLAPLFAMAETTDAGTSVEGAVVHIPLVWRIS